MGRRNPGPINAPSTWELSYGTGALGALTIGSNTNWSALTSTAQTMNYTHLTIDNTFTLTLNGGHKPHILRCTGVCTINGGIDGDGRGFAGGPSQATTGLGPGPGLGADVLADEGGGGAGHAADGTNGGGSGGGWGLGGNAYSGLGDILSQSYGTYCAGSGGGAGGTSAGTPGTGGAGGGGLVIVARSVVIGSTAVISLDGSNGTNATPPGGGGGGGSGGFLLILADSISLPASGNVITATAGSGGTGTAAGGAGAVGRIYLVYTRWISGDSAARCNPDAVEINLIPTVSAG